MMNIYRGNVMLDSDGKATVEMPAWFQAENAEFSYQLTPIRDAAPNLHIAQEVKHNEFDIAGGKPGLKVSWIVTGIRQDAYAKAHPFQVEQDKTGREKGKYLDPVDWGKSKSLGIDYENRKRTETMRKSIQSVKSLPEPPAPPMPKLPSLKSLDLTKFSSDSSITKPFRTNK